MQALSFVIRWSLRWHLPACLPACLPCISLSTSCLVILCCLQSDPAWAFFMCFEHERIHIETSSVLMRELPVSLLRRPPQWPAYHPSVADVERLPPANDLLAGGWVCCGWRRWWADN
jgi:hypothetical protein